MMICFIQWNQLGGSETTREFMQQSTSYYLLYQCPDRDDNGGDAAVYILVVLPSRGS
jgi:hypothetical protein